MVGPKSIRYESGIGDSNIQCPTGVAHCHFMVGFRLRLRLRDQSITYAAPGRLHTCTCTPGNQTRRVLHVYAVLYPYSTVYHGILFVACHPT